MKTLRRGQIYTGTVTKILPFGTIARIEERRDGVEGLVRHGPDEKRELTVEVGDTLPVKILDVDPAHRQITLALPHTLRGHRDRPDPP